MKQVMGIINVNGESFYSESRRTTSDQIRRKITQMVDEGADILDFGACSTRPGSTPVSESREWEGIRLALSIVRDELKDKDSACSRLFKRVGQRYALSIDTFRSSIVEKACDYIGDFTINDISAGLDSADIAGLVTSFNSLLDKLQDSDGTVGSLINEKTVYDSVDSLVSDLDRLVRKIEENPKKYLRISVF